MVTKKFYDSPRWSGEICDCSMPMTFDTYSACSFNCIYCFAYFQKSHSVDGYMDRKPVPVNTDKIVKLFTLSLEGRKDELNAGDQQFYEYIHSRTVMQWGGLNDPFDKYEEKYGVSLDLLRFFDKVDYPLSISTKGVFFTKDPRYMSLIKKHKHNWHFKISIITNDEAKSRSIDRGCPSVRERIEAIKILADNGLHVTLRLRPYIIGISDDYKQLILRAKKAGADSVTTEFFCLEARANTVLKNRYKEMSKIVGYDIWDFYRENSNTNGYKRLNYTLKTPIINSMRDFVHQLDMRFYVSDSHHKEASDYCCCCGVPPTWNISKGQYAEALLIAKKYGTVKWSDISEEAEKLFGKVLFYKAHGFNTGSNRKRSERWLQTLSQMMREIWNTPTNGKSPYKYFEGVLYPIGLDSDNNIIYQYRQDKKAPYKTKETKCHNNGKIGLKND